MFPDAEMIWTPPEQEEYTVLAIGNFAFWYPIRPRPDKDEPEQPKVNRPLEVA